MKNSSDFDAAKGRLSNSTDAGARKVILTLKNSIKDLHAGKIWNQRKWARILQGLLKHSLLVDVSNLNILKGLNQFSSSKVSLLPIFGILFLKHT